MDNMKSIFEEIRVRGSELADKVKALIHEGNVRRIIIKNEQGHTFIEIPVTVAAVGIVFAPVLAAIGALAAMAAHFTVVVERAVDPAQPPAHRFNPQKSSKSPQQGIQATPSPAVTLRLGDERRAVLR